MNNELQAVLPTKNESSRGTSSSNIAGNDPKVSQFLE